MSKVVLKALRSFSVAGKDHLAGTTFPVEDTLRWPEGSLQRRLNNGFCEYVAAEEKLEENQVKRGPGRPPKAVEV